MFSEDYRRGVCLDGLDVGLNWNALINSKKLCKRKVHRNLMKVMLVVMLVCLNHALGFMLVYCIHSSIHTSYYSVNRAILQLKFPNLAADIDWETINKGRCARPSVYRILIIVHSFSQKCKENSANTKCANVFLYIFKFDRSYFQ